MGATMTKDPRFAGHVTAEAVVASGDGLVVLGGSDAKGAGDRAWLAGFDGKGGLLWQRSYPEGKGSYGRAVVAVAGGFVIVGEVQRSDDDFQALALAVGGDGQRGAAATFGAGGVTGLDAAAVVADGSVMAGGGTRGQGWLVQLDAATLARTAEHALPAVRSITGVAARAGGGFAVCAIAETSTSELGVSAAAAYGADGKTAWVRRVPEAGTGELAGLAATDGGVIVVGQRQRDGRGKSLIWACKLDDAGAVVWDHLIGAAEEEHRGRAVVALPDGGVVVAGHAVRDYDHREIVVARLGDDGTPLWERRLGGGPMEVVRGLAVLPDGGLAVVGSTTRGPSRSNAWVSRLDVVGEIVWEKIFDDYDA